MADDNSTRKRWEMGLKGERKDAYVYGTLAKIEKMREGKKPSASSQR